MGQFLKKKIAQIKDEKDMKHKRNEDIDVYDMETCEICNQSFKSTAALRGHRYRYHADRDHKYSRSPKGNKNVTLCKICQFPCASEKALWMHLDRKHPELEKRKTINESVQNSPKNRPKPDFTSITKDSPSNPGLGVSLVINKKVLKSVDNTPLIEQTQHQRISRRTSMQLGFSPDKIVKMLTKSPSPVKKFKPDKENKTYSPMSSVGIFDVLNSPIQTMPPEKRKSGMKDSPLTKRRKVSKKLYD